MNKIATKKMLSYHKISTPDFLVFDESRVTKLTPNSIAESIIDELDLPVVVKAPTQGSTLGIYFIKKEEELIPAIIEALKYDKELLVEKMLEGTEITASIIGNLNPQVLPLIEIVSHTGYYDFKAKYTPGLSEHIIPARIDNRLKKVIEEIASFTYLNLGCKGFSRVDFIVSNNVPYVLEVNSIPGMTETSLLPDAAKAAGITFNELIQHIVELAIIKKQI